MIGVLLADSASGRQRPSAWDVLDVRRSPAVSGGGWSSSRPPPSTGPRSSTAASRNPAMKLWKIDVTGASDVGPSAPRRQRRRPEDPPPNRDVRPRARCPAPDPGGAVGHGAALGVPGCFGLAAGVRCCGRRRSAGVDRLSSEAEIRSLRSATSRDTFGAVGIAFADDPAGRGVRSVRTLGISRPEDPLPNRDARSRAHCPAPDPGGAVGHEAALGVPGWFGWEAGVRCCGRCRSAGVDRLGSEAEVRSLRGVASAQFER